MSKDHVFKGKASGGPLNGSEVVNNASKGFVLVNEKFDNVWIYDFDSNSNTFQAQNEGPFSVNEEKLTKAENDEGRSVRILSEGDDSNG